MWDSRLEPRLFPRSLREPWPDDRNIQEAQVLKEDASTEAQRLNDKIIEEVVCRSRKIVCQNCRDISRISDDPGNDIGNAGGDCCDKYEFDEKEGKIKVLRDKFAFTPRWSAHQDCQLSHQCRYNKLNQQCK